MTPSLASNRYVGITSKQESGQVPTGGGGRFSLPQAAHYKFPFGLLLAFFSIFFFLEGGVVFKTITVFYYKSKIKFILEILEYTVKYKEDKNQL